MLLAGSLKLLLLSTNDIVCFGNLIAYAVILLRGGFPWLVVLVMMSDHALRRIVATISRFGTHESGLGSCLEEVGYGKQVVMSDAHLHARSAL